MEGGLRQADDGVEVAIGEELFADAFREGRRRFLGLLDGGLGPHALLAGFDQLVFFTLQAAISLIEGSLGRSQRVGRIAALFLGDFQEIHEVAALLCNLARQGREALDFLFDMRAAFDQFVEMGLRALATLLPGAEFVGDGEEACLALLRLALQAIKGGARFDETRPALGHFGTQFVDAVAGGI